MVFNLLFQVFNVLSLNLMLLVDFFHIRKHIKRLLLNFCIFVLNLSFKLNHLGACFDVRLLIRVTVTFDLCDGLFGGFELRAQLYPLILHLFHFLERIKLLLAMFIFLFTYLLLKLYHSSFHLGC